MNTLCSQIIPSCLLLVLLFLLYCAICLDKFQDYHDALAQSLKRFRQLAADLEKILSFKDQASKESAQSAEITVIDFQIHRELEQALSNQDARRKFSIRFNPTSNSLKRKNSIDYTIQINSNSDPNDESPSLHEKLQLESNYQNPSNDQLSPCLRTSLQVNTILPKGRVYETVKEPLRSGDRHSSGYLKTYMEYERRSRNELVSVKNARSSQNMQKRVSFIDLCEMNGVKTIRDLIKEKQRQRNWLKQEEKREKFNHIKTRQIDG